MRVTERMIHRGVVDEIHGHQAAMAKLQQQIASGQRLTGLSEEPIDAARSIRLRAAAAGLDQYKKNTQEALAWMNATLGGLGRVREVLQEARLDALQGGTDSTPPESRQALAETVARLRESLVELGNSKWEDASLFGGHATTATPFAPDGTYRGDTGAIGRDIAPGETTTVNYNGDEVFQSGTNLFAALDNLETALRNNDPAAVRAAVPALDAGIGKILRFEASLGAETERVTLTRSRLDEMSVTLAQRRSENDDTDMAQAAVDLQNENNVYEASLAASARLFGASLLDFLK